METKFFNRELSWIEFNNRILYNAFKKELPLMERLQFLSIVSSNFDEFFQVRVASVKRMEKSNPKVIDDSGYTPKSLLRQISVKCHKIIKEQHSLLMNELVPLLAEKNLKYTTIAELDAKQKIFVTEFFENEVFPFLTPLRTDSNLFPHLINLSEYIAFYLKAEDAEKQKKSPFKGNDKASKVAFVQIPNGLDRIVWLPTENGKKQFVLLEELILEFGKALFPGFYVKESMIFKIARDADFSVDEDSKGNFIKEMEKVLVKRQSSFVVQLLCTSTSQKIVDFLKKKLNIENDDIYIIDGILNPQVLMDLRGTSEGRNLGFSEWEHFYPVSLPKEEPYWDVLRNEDVLLHVPYESYDPVIKFITDAAEDENVLSIKMTLYRTGNNSPIISALKKAAANGKQVCVLVELKARFDEERNIGWANELESAGVTVVYGLVNLKVHAKILMVIRKDDDIVRRYVHLSTGNYNPKTAKLYSDLSLFTTNQNIASDATLFFNMVTGYSDVQELSSLNMAPISIKSKLLDMIQREIDKSTKENPGLIIAKMNSLTHEDVIKALYKASCAGVKVLLNVRGICMLVPGVKGMSENIKVVSIVDRYLEHSRIFYFQNGSDSEIYLASADWMPRNLERRVELMFPILDKKVFKEVKSILDVYFEDNCNAHELKKDGEWIPVLLEEGQSKRRSQELLYKKYKRRNDSYEKIKQKKFEVRKKIE